MYVIAFYYPSDELFRSAFTSDELKTMVIFDQTFHQICDSTPERLPYIDESVLTNESQVLTIAAGLALRAFPDEELLSALT